MKPSIRIGTRKSELAQWQAKLVRDLLEKQGVASHLVLVDSEGDQNQTVPLYEMGVVGVFTKTLDIALLNNKIDIAVHSMKDVPVALPKGIIEFAVLERGEVEDVFVKHPKNEFSTAIATSSLRRRAQWLNKYPEFSIEELRGNVNTRLQKVAESNWKGAVFAKAGLERIHVLPKDAEILDWMIPAPAQGAIMVVGRENEPSILEALQSLNHSNTSNCVTIERQVLKILEGGCTAPIAVNVKEMQDNYNVSAGIYSLDGKRKVEIFESFEKENHTQIANQVSKMLLQNGGEAIMKEIKAFNNKK